MPEGPSIVILKELVQPFTGKKVTEVSGNSKLDIQRLAGKKIIAFKSWGKHFLICFDKFTIRIHFLLFGSYRINEDKDAVRVCLYSFQKASYIFTLAPFSSLKKILMKYTIGRQM
jgi:endonuclease-8